MSSTRITLSAVLMALLLNGSASAEGHGGHRPKSDPIGAASPYAGLETREIKSLSTKETEDLRAGRGMGLALAAELNGYPGPTHVIDLAEALALTEVQRRRTNELLAAMRAEAVPLGEKIVGAETGLDRAFRDGTITVETLSAATAEIGRLRGELRAAHLRYHIILAQILSPEQRRRYRQLRGYDAQHRASSTVPHGAD